MALLLLSLFSAQSSAQTVDWASAGSGRFDEAGNWAGGQLPTASDEARIGAAGTPYVVSLETDQSVSMLTVDADDATVRHTDGVLTLQDQLAILRGRYELAGGTISGGSLNGDGITIQSGVLNGVSVENGLSLQNAPLLLSNGTSINGDISILDSVLTANQDFEIRAGDLFEILVQAPNTPSPSLVIQGNHLLTIAEGAELSLRQIGNERFARPMVTVEGDLVNRGTVSSSDAGWFPGITVDGQFHNHGLLVSRRDLRVSAGAAINRGEMLADGGLLSVSQVHNLGTLRAISGGNLALLGQWRNEGTIEVDNQSTLNLQGSFQTSDIGTIDQAPGGQVVIRAMVDNQGATLSGGAGWSIRNSSTVSGGVINGDGFVFHDLVTLSDVDLVGEARVLGTLRLEDSSTFEKVSVAVGLSVESQHTIRSGSQIHFEDSTSVSGGSFFSESSEPVAITFEENSIISGQGKLRFAAGTITLNGILSPSSTQPAAVIGPAIQLTGDANYVMGSDAELIIDLVGSDHDMLAAQNLTLDGSLLLRIGDDFTVAEGNSFTIASFQNGSGQFIGLDENDIAATVDGFDLRIQYQRFGDQGRVRLFAVSAIPEPSVFAFSVFACAALVIRRRTRR